LAGADDDRPRAMLRSHPLLPLRLGVLALMALAFCVFIWSAVRPYDWLTWFLEVFPGVGGAIILALTWRRFRFTPLVYGLVALHAMILFIGGHYTYARVPLFNWLKDHYHLSRNHYDRVGHFAQGFVPAMIARELLLRRSPLTRGKWLTLLVICICMAISAWYELFEWLTALVSGSNATAFLGTQGDQWDTQEDMACAFIGAVLSLILMSKWQDRQMAAMEGAPAAG
jgi:putative membrane protein